MTLMTLTRLIARRIDRLIKEESELHFDFQGECETGRMIQLKKIKGEEFLIEIETIHEITKATEFIGSYFSPSEHTYRAILMDIQNVYISSDSDHVQSNLDGSVCEFFEEMIKEEILFRSRYLSNTANY